MDASGLTRCRVVQPSLATLLAKPNKGMHDSIFASNNGQTRKLQSYFPDPTMDIDNKVRCLTSASAVYTAGHAATYALNLSAARHALPAVPGSKAFMGHLLTSRRLLMTAPGDDYC